MQHHTNNTDISPVLISRLKDLPFTTFAPEMYQYVQGKLFIYVPENCEAINNWYDDLTLLINEFRKSGADIAFTDYIDKSTNEHIYCPVFGSLYTQILIGGVVISKEKLNIHPQLKYLFGYSGIRNNPTRNIKHIPIAPFIINTSSNYNQDIEILKHGKRNS